MVENFRVYICCCLVHYAENIATRLNIALWALNPAIDSDGPLCFPPKSEYNQYAYIQLVHVRSEYCRRLHFTYTVNNCVMRHDLPLNM